MNKTESAKFIESVSGTIIGDFYSTGQLFSEGRQQGPRFIGSTDHDIRAQATRHVETLKDSLGPEFKRLYPDGMELRIWD